MPDVASARVRPTLVALAAGLAMSVASTALALSIEPYFSASITSRRDAVNIEDTINNALKF